MEKREILKKRASMILSRVKAIEELSNIYNLKDEQWFIDYRNQIKRVLNSDSLKSIIVEESKAIVKDIDSLYITTKAEDLIDEEWFTNFKDSLNKINTK